jgi:hypothetical protein
MKKLILCFLLASSFSYASECPKLQGEYHCVLSQNRYSVLKVTQEVVSPTESTESVAYSFHYLALPWGADIVIADLDGEIDQLGWINSCFKNKIRSIAVNGSLMSELYLDEQGALVRTLNGKVEQICPAKN